MDMSICSPAQTIIRFKPTRSETSLLTAAKQPANKIAAKFILDQDITQERYDIKDVLLPKFMSTKS